MKNKKAQTSLEYLMTYGWVILIIIVALVIVWQWGLFQPKEIPNGHSGFWGVIPEDFSFDSNGNLQLSLKNDVGAKINITRIYVETGGEPYTSGILNYEVSPGGRQPWSYTFSSSSAKQPAGSRFEISIWIEYQDSRVGETYRSSGKIWGSVEAV